jgi:heat shock protein HtpX
MQAARDGDAVPREAGATQVAEGAWPEVEDVLDEISRVSNIPRPTLWYLPEQPPNAFASGSAPDQAAITLTGGLVEVLDRRELRGVLAHEVGHVANGDVAATTEIVRRAMTGVALANLGTWVVADMFDSPLLWLVGAIGSAAYANRKSRDIAEFNRTRELAADRFAIAAAGEAAGLQSALVKLERSMLDRQVPEWLRFAAIVEPPHPEATHPPTLQRVTEIEAGPLTSLRSCAHCAYPEATDHDYCRRCGHPTTQSRCEACEHPVDTYALYCSACGARRALPGAAAT